VFRVSGSVLPFAIQASVPSVILGVVVSILYEQKMLERLEVPSPVFASATSLIGFLVIFRAQIAYNRFWDGANKARQMMVLWYDCAASVSSFCVNSSAEPQTIDNLKCTLVRLFSLLHAVSLVELESGKMKHKNEFKASTIESLSLIEQKLAHEYMRCLKESDYKVELVYSWIQATLLTHMGNGVLNTPPPIFNSAFSKLSDGLAKFHECSSIADTPFPFPFSQTTLALMALFSMFSPLALCSLVTKPVSVGFFSLFSIYSLWSLYALATELEDPFGTDANDLGAPDMQNEMNHRLLLLVNPYSSSMPQAPKDSATPKGSALEVCVNLAALYEGIDEDEEPSVGWFADILTRSSVKSNACDYGISHGQSQIVLPDPTQRFMTFGNSRESLSTQCRGSNFGASQTMDGALVLDDLRSQPNSAPSRTPTVEPDFTKPRADKVQVTKVPPDTLGCLDDVDIESSLQKPATLLRPCMTRGVHVEVASTGAREVLQVSPEDVTL